MKYKLVSSHALHACSDALPYFNKKKKIPFEFTLNFLLKNFYLENLIGICVFLVKVLNFSIYLWVFICFIHFQSSNIWSKFIQ